MKKVLVIHPEGNFSFNPSLFSMIKSLQNFGYEVDYLCEQNDRIEQSLGLNCTTFYFDKKISLDWNPESCLSRLKEISFEQYEMVLAVDLGVLYGSVIFKSYGIPYIYISYEIIFNEECDKTFKKYEKEAILDAEYVIVTDPIRKSILHLENRIALKKIFWIPVAGKINKSNVEENYLYTQYNIPKEKKIALHLGSISEWSQIFDIICNKNLWEKDWVLFLHGRYGISREIRYLVRNNKNIILSHESLSDILTLSKIVKSCQIGFAFYKPTFKDIYDGRNLLYLGLSSGKISTYLCYGLPVLTNEIGIISSLIRNNKCGNIVKDVNTLTIDDLNFIDYQLSSYHAINLFKKLLDFSLYEHLFHDIIKKTIGENDIMVEQPENSILDIDILIGSYSNLVNLLLLNKSTNSIKKVKQICNFFYIKVMSKIFFKLRHCVHA